MKVWASTLAIWAGFYAFFVAVFGSADGAHVLSEGAVRRMAAAQASNPSTKKEAKAVAVDFTARDSSSAAEDRAKAIEWAAQALSPISPKKKAPAASRARSPSPAMKVAPAKPARSKSPAAPKAATPKKSTPKKRVKAASFAVGDLVDVESHNEPGSKPRPGGVARVTKVHEDGSVDVTYVMGGREADVEAELCSLVDANAGETKRASRPSQKRAAAEESSAPAEKPKRSRR